jgi:hypothetical protein
MSREIHLMRRVNSLLKPSVLSPAQPQPLVGSHSAASFFQRASAVVIALLVAAGLVAAPAMSQGAPTQPPADTAAAQKPVRTHKRADPAHLVQQVPPAPATPPQPEIPKWPAFDQPTQAAVAWDSHGLTIDAANSSLQQILNEVSTVTGVKVAGMSGDQRVFGIYGPGPARDILSQLLQGSGYNVIMIGGETQGAPREIQLSPRQSNNAAATPKTNPANGNGEDEDQEDEQPPMQPNFQPGVPPRSPQQLRQEMERRQQQMQQQFPQQPN